MQLPTQGFFHVDAGNIVTWAAIAVAWIANRGMDWKSIQDRTRYLELWQKEHDEDCKERAISMKQLESSNAKLVILAEFAERRLNSLEKRTYGRRD